MTATTILGHALRLAEPTVTHPWADRDVHLVDVNGNTLCGAHGTREPTRRELTGNRGTCPACIRAAQL